MAEGLQVFDSSGHMTFNTTTVVFKKLGEFTVHSLINGSITDDNMRGRKISLFIKDISVVKDGVSLGTLYPTQWVINDNTISWQFRAIRYNVHTLPTIAEYNITYEYGWLV